MVGDVLTDSRGEYTVLWDGQKANGGDALLPARATKTDDQSKYFTMSRNDIARMPPRRLPYSKYGMRGWRE
jgi:hypothetical protein